MSIAEQLRLSSGEKLEIPERLHPIVIAAKALDSAALEMDDPDRDLEAILIEIRAAVVRGPDCLAYLMLW